MATKTMNKKTYTVRVETVVTYYCDTIVEAASREEAADLAMAEHDHDEIATAPAAARWSRASSVTTLTAKQV